MAASLSLAVGAFNAIVDPFDMFGFVSRPGYIDTKPAISTRLKLMKAYDARRVGVRAIALGSSRVLVAIRMTHPGWSADARPRYNLAFDSATPDEVFAYLQHAEAIRPLRQVVLGLDTWWLTGFPTADSPDFDPTVLDAPGSLAAHVRMHLSDARLLLSLDTFEASLKTLRQPRGLLWDTIDPTGQRDGAAYFHRALTGISVLGPSRFFDRADVKLVASMVPRPPAIATSTDSPTIAIGLDGIEQIVAFCREHSIDLRMYITPQHAHQVEAAFAIGEWPQVEAAKRRLVGILAEDAARHPGARQFPLWDFSGYSTVTTEAVPAPGDPHEMKYYWEASHAKQIVGDFILDRIFAVREHGKRVPADFGRRLDASNVEAVIAAGRLGHARYAKTNPEDVAKLRSEFAEARASSP